MTHGWHSHARLMKWLRALPAPRNAAVQHAIDTRGKGLKTWTLAALYQEGLRAIGREA